MYHSPDIVTPLIAFLVPFTVLGIIVWRCGLWRKFLTLSNPKRVFAAAVFAALVGYGGQKGGPAVPSRVLELITVLRDGTLTDVSGKVASGVQAKALQQFSDESYRLVQATTNIIEQARLDCIALTNQLSQADYSVAYISLDMPRGVPAEPNHNIMVGIERMQQSTSNVTAWVWFSDFPATNVNVRLDYSIREGIWSPLMAVTNHYPATELIGGVECVKYEYAIPEAIAGTPLRPQYEVEFGGFLPEEFLSVPDTGVTVTVGSEEFLPHTGWVTLGDGEDAIGVHIVGGIAVAATQAGTNYVGNCLL